MKPWEIKVTFRNRKGETENVKNIVNTDDIDREIIIIKNTIKSLGGLYLGAAFRVYEEENTSKL